MHVNPTLSISQAWDETKGRIASDGRLLFITALALIAMPAAITQFAIGAPLTQTTPGSLPELIVMFAVWILSLAGQLALIRLAIGPSVSVGEAIAHGFRRLLPYLGALLIIVLAMIVLFVPFILGLAATGVTLTPGVRPPPVAYLILVVFMVVALYFGMRMLLVSPVASTEAAGPVAIVRRSWVLTRGQAGKLIGFILLFVVAAVLLMAAVNVVLSLAFTLSFGPVEPRSVAALVIALVEAIISATVTTIFVVMISRFYRQLSAGHCVEPSVPSSGT